MAEQQQSWAMPSTSASAASEAVAAAVSAVTTAATNQSLVLWPPMELLKLPLRAVYNAELFTFVTVPQNLVRFVGLEGMFNSGWTGTAHAAADGDTMGAAAAAAAAAASAGATATTRLDGAVDGPIGEVGLNFTDVFQALRRFSGLFSYMTSRWSLTCFSVALILNRVTIYASTRRHLTLGWDKRLALRIIPIVLFIFRVLALLQAIRCQTSPEYSELRYGRPEKRLPFDYAGGGGFLYSMSSMLLPWQTDRQSCRAVNMDRAPGATDIPHGSFALLWPVFISLCVSHFVETLSCALQGRTVVTEAGMSIFEHSLAFAEAETTISQSIGLGLFGISKSSPIRDDLSITADGSSSSVHLLTRSEVLERMNVAPELLLIILISCLNSLSSNILDVFGKQSRFRLINTTIWGLCFMGAILSAFLDAGSLGSEPGFLRFPTVLIVGFVPHLLILLGILVCLSIYAVAVLITALTITPDGSRPPSWAERFAFAHANMQGGNQIRNVRLNMHEDFYTTLLRLGYAALTAASEAAFLNEGRSVVARRMTWLEEDRLTEIETSRRRVDRRGRQRTDTGSGRVGPGDASSFGVSGHDDEGQTGYGRERKIERSAGSSRPVNSQSSLGGVGAFQGASRCYQGVSFFRAIFFVLLKWFALGLSKVLDRVGITTRPRWLNDLVGTSGKGKKRRVREQPASLDFWILTDDGDLELPEDNEFDVEKEMRKREIVAQTQWNEADETRLENKLYSWWKAGGSWGNQDESPDYQPQENDFDDNTSVISAATTTESEWESYESDGRRTPTQGDPFPERSIREESPLPETLLDASLLARLLDPRDKESKEEARILAAHLTTEQSGRIMTRSRYQRQTERERARVLMPPRFGSLESQTNSQAENSEKTRPTPDEEVEILENLIITRRQEAAANSRKEAQPTWQSGASGLGPEGPQCVICQTNPRSIITWPCRCLCVCEDCRVSLAMNNFGSCVTCRQEVGGFVRLWVP